MTPNLDPMVAMASAVNRIEQSQKDLVEYVNGLRNVIDALDGVAFYAVALHLNKDFKYTEANVKKVQDEITKVKKQATKYLAKQQAKQEKKNGADKSSDKSSNN